MKFLSALGLLMALSWTVQAQTIHVQSRDNAPDLLCGTEAAAKPRAATPAAALLPPAEAHVPGLVVNVGARDPENRKALLTALENRPPLRIALWGDSHGAARFFSDELIAALGLPAERVLPSFLPATLARPGVRLPLRKFCQSSGWQSSLAFTSPQANVPYYLGLATLKTAQPGATLQVDLRNKQGRPQIQSLELYFQPPAPESDDWISISVDDGPEHQTRISPGLRGVVRIRPNTPLSTLRIRLLTGSITLEGLRLHYAQEPLVYFDTLAIPGATARGWRMLDTEYFRQRNGAQGNEPDYDVAILEYGTNEANERNFEAGNYQRDLRQTLGQFRRIYPRAQCYLIGPTDRGLPDKAALFRLTASGPAEALLYAQRHETISRIQQNLSREFQCRAWNWQDAMGGPGAAYRWFWNDPPLMAKDMIHLTPAGYRLSARLFADFLRWPEELEPGQ